MGDLSSDKRAELRARRDLLRAEHVLATKRSYIARLLEPLDEMGIPYEIRYDDYESMAWLQPFFNWEMEAFPHFLGVRIARGVSNARMIRWMKAVVKREALRDGPIVWTTDNGAEPTVQLLLSDFLRIPAPELQRALNGHVWVMRAQERWTFEIHGSDIWWGRVPDSPPAE